MRFKNFIALFFVLLFFGKLVTVDAKAYTLLLESKGISLVNRFCEKGKFLDASDQQQLQESEQHLNLEMDFLCQAPVQLEVFKWQPLIAENNFKQQTYHYPPLLEVFSDRFYPPPRL